MSFAKAIEGHADEFPALAEAIRTMEWIDTPGQIVRTPCSTAGLLEHLAEADRIVRSAGIEHASLGVLRDLSRQRMDPAPPEWISEFTVLPA